jgi:hypothetical protein
LTSISSVLQRQDQQPHDDSHSIALQTYLYRLSQDNAAIMRSIYEGLRIRNRALAFQFQYGIEMT